jgi:hypothetical protein
VSEPGSFLLCQALSGYMRTLPSALLDAPASNRVDTLPGVADGASARGSSASAGQIQLRNHIRDSQDEYGRTLSASTG